MHLGSTVTTAGFWIGTLLPVVYIPVFLTGIDSIARLSLFVGLVTVNVAALVVGHDYRGSRSQPANGASSSREPESRSGSGSGSGPGSGPGPRS